MLVDLDKFELMYYIEGCARGSHLRQGIWCRIVEEFIPKMDVKEIDFIWWITRRDLWEVFYDCLHYPRCGQEDYLHALAALNRNNWATITIKDKRKTLTVRCYRFDGKWHLQGKFNMYVPEEIIKKIEKEEVSTENMEHSYVAKWKDISIYEKYEPTCKEPKHAVI